MGRGILITEQLLKRGGIRFDVLTLAPGQCDQPEVVDAVAKQTWTRESSSIHNPYSTGQGQLNASFNEPVSSQFSHLAEQPQLLIFLLLA